MRIAIYIKEYNLGTGNISLNKTHLRAYWNGQIEAIDVFRKDNGQTLESYYGDGLERLFCSVKPVKGDSGETSFYLAKRWLAE